jgi:hypothetical protein
MKQILATSFALPLSLFALAVRAQTYSIDWFKISGGGAPARTASIP